MDFSKVKEYTIPEGRCIRLTAADGTVLWRALDTPTIELRGSALVISTADDSTESFVVHVSKTAGDLGGEDVEVVVEAKDEADVVIPDIPEAPEEEEPEAGQLAYVLSTDGTYYTCVGMGTVHDRDIVVENYFKYLPVAAIAEESFFNNNFITGVDIPENVASIGEGAFASCDELINITVSSNNNAYQSIDGNLYTKDGKILVQYAIGKSAAIFTIPNGVETIGTYAVANAFNITTLNIPNTVKLIGDKAFYGNNLASIRLSDGVTSIGEEAFYGSLKVTSLIIPNSVTNIGRAAFYGSSKLASVIIGSGVNSIGQGCFASCRALTTINFNGTTAQWNAIKKDSNWNTGSYITEIVCSDGTITL